MTRAGEIAQLEDRAFRSHRTFHKPSSMFASTTERFPRERTDSPPPGAYECHSHEIAHNTSNRTDFTFRSGSPRLPEPRAEGPPATAYIPQSAGTGQQKRESAVFRSKSPRLPENKNMSPDYYAPENGTIAANVHRQTSRGTPHASYKSSTPRMSSPRTEGPGPGFYEVERSPSRNRGNSAVFKSSSPRFRSKTPETPPPGAYEIRSSFSTSRNSQGSPFRSSSERFRSPKTEAPGPGHYHTGDYDVRVSAFLNQPFGPRHDSIEHPPPYN